VNPTAAILTPLTCQGAAPAFGTSFAGTGQGSFRLTVIRCN